MAQLIMAGVAKAPANPLATTGVSMAQDEAAAGIGNGSTKAPLAARSARQASPEEMGRGAAGGAGGFGTPPQAAMNRSDARAATRPASGTWCFPPRHFASRLSTPVG